MMSFTQDLSTFATSRMDTGLVMSRADRSKVFGIECSGSDGSDGILFKGGECGPHILLFKLAHQRVITRRFRYESAGCIEESH